MPLLPVNECDSSTVCDILQKAASALMEQEGRVGCTHHIPSVGTILVSGDLHDNSENFAKIIHLASLENPENHVVLQELIHAGNTSLEADLSYRMIVQVAALVLKYPNQVHPLLANHELSQVTNRLISKHGIELLYRFIDGIDQVFGKDADNVLDAMYAFVLSMPLAVRSASGLFCSHSLPDEMKMDEFDIEILDRELVPTDLQGPYGSAYMMVWGRNYSVNQVERLAEYWEVKLFCLGHAWVPDGIEIAMDNVLLINSDHENGAVLLLPLDNIQNANEAMKTAVRL